MNQTTHNLFQKLDKLIDIHEKHLNLLQKHLDLLVNKPVVVPVDSEFKDVQSTQPQDSIINRKEEEEFGGDMSPQELAKLFGEEYVEKPEPKFSEMSIKEIDEWQKEQDDSTDIYKVKARVTNLARESGVGITPNGEAMINTYVHVLMAFYDFASTIKDKTLRKELIELVRSREGFPSDVINITLPPRRR